LQCSWGDRGGDRPGGKLRPEPGIGSWRKENGDLTTINGDLMVI